MFKWHIFHSLSIWPRLYNAHKNVYLFHFLNPENQIIAYIDDVITAWQIHVHVLWKWK